MIPDEKDPDVRPLSHSVALIGVFVIMASLGGLMGGSVREASNKEVKREKPLEQRTYELRIENVIGKEIPDKFYEINGKRYFLEIDGQLVENYF